MAPQIERHSTQAASACRSPDSDPVRRLAYLLPVYDLIDSPGRAVQRLRREWPAPRGRSTTSLDSSRNVSPDKVFSQQLPFET